MVNRGFALIIGFLAVLAPAMAHAQTNIDQGKSASQIFANACAECHKAPHALAKGKSYGTVAEFLREHYTTGRDQAAALAAYVVAGRDTVAAPLPGRRPPAEVPGQKPAKPAEGASANAKPHRPGEAEASRKEDAGSGNTPTFMNPIARPEPIPTRPATATRNRRRELGIPEPPQEPSAVAHAPAEANPEPARPEPPVQEAAPTSAVAPTAAVPTEAPAGESGETAPRDNIPD